jgi:CDP-4-dehydro-6-deoxyglucose reductase, E3
MSPVRRFTATVANIRQLTHDVRQIDLQLIEPKEVTFKAGQFVSFEVPDVRTGRTVTRPYSIASSPGSPHVISLLFNLVPGGPGSTYLSSLREGESTTFAGPAGHFYLRDDPARDLLFVATGTGIAPIRSMLLANAERQKPQRAALLWSVRSQRDLYYQDELAGLKKRHSEVMLITTLSRPEPGWTGPTGRVTQLVEQSVAEVKQLAAYLCGNSGMIKEVTDIIQTKGMCPIFREKYYDDAGGEVGD